MPPPEAREGVVTRASTAGAVKIDLLPFQVRLARARQRCAWTLDSVASDLATGGEPPVGFVTDMAARHREALADLEDAIDERGRR